MSAFRTRVKICCIASTEEAAVAIELGADALGLVAAMPSGIGPIPDTRIASIRRRRAAAHRERPPHVGDNGGGDRGPCRRDAAHGRAGRRSHRSGGVGAAGHPAARRAAHPGHPCRGA